MTDAHCHVSGGDPAVRELLIGRDFIGVHPWDADTVARVPSPCPDTVASAPSPCPDIVARAPSPWLAEIHSRLAADPKLGVGEIGLDRLHDREISAVMREVFEAQLALAAEFHRPVVLHGAKCWGQVVKACVPYRDQIPAFLFHGFSRSDGLLPDIVALNGFISVGPAIMNDHAVNYRELVKKIPLERLLVETDRTEASAAECPTIAAILAKLAALRNLPADTLENHLDANAEHFSCVG